MTAVENWTPATQTIPGALRQMLTAYHQRLQWEPLPPGLSGAAVWRGVDEQGQAVAVLKRWPPSMTNSRLSRIHQWLQQAGHLPFAPQVLQWAEGGSWRIYQGHCWDLSRWQAGQPRWCPTWPELRRACQAVALLHSAWPTVATGSCPGVSHRWQWLTLAPQILTRLDDLRRRYPQWEPLWERIRSVLHRHLPPLKQALQSILHLEASLQVCWRDLRQEHLLFVNGLEGPQISGIIDYGAADIDHPAVDLARLLGDYAAASPEPMRVFAEGLAAYEEAGRTLGPWRETVPLLHQTGTLAAIIRWLQRLYQGLESPLQLSVVLQRLTELLRCWP
jgi:Ser/Thr protein kinase RdoA (MazF antagonist)